MYCVKCGNFLNEGDKFCGACGQPVESANNSNVNDNQVNVGGTNNVDDELLRAYIGPKYDKMNSSNFNIYAFAFGATYTMYRKMWLLSLILFCVSIAVNTILGGISFFVQIGIGIFLAIKWKDLYFKHCKEKIEEIKSQMPNATREQLIAVCTQKGGTTIVPVIIVSIIIAIYLIFIILIFIIVFGAIGSGIENIPSIYPDYTQSLINIIPNINL